MTDATKQRLAPWIATAALFLVWELACRVFGVPEFILPTPYASFSALVNASKIRSLDVSTLAFIPSS